MNGLTTLLILLALLAGPLRAQDVQPGDLTLTLTIEDGPDVPYVGEMVLVTLEGRFRLPIIREAMIQPDLEGFSWMQLGTDYWSDQRIDGYPVKVFRRRMALFPERAGALTIGAFTHRLTLLGPHNKWVEHDIASDPLDIEVAPPPPVDGWWLPVRQLRVADEWSNAPDQLGAGEGVLRVIRVEALGISPDLLPPMPEMTSPGAVIFPHPEKRLVDLSAQGPVAVAFWRWTVMPQTPPSAIIEPITFRFFDTVARQMRSVTISPQRVAVSDADMPDPDPPPPPGPARTGLRLGALAAGLLAGLGALLAGRGAGRRDEVLWALGLHPDQRALSRAVRMGDAPGCWRAAQALGRAHDGLNEDGRKALDRLEQDLFGTSPKTPDLAAFRRSFLGALGPRNPFS
ncbi:MAG: hypothetical protein CML68_18590 [Rhodobacteraceae bacterium]|nr:hypothetical protein [Paracoccaceae bacterium]